ncbi:MAG: long-chain fatty acid--CoA ligase [Candidatus Hydrogenedentes bacterium]|nr:long-chain fatty acid--CoA ligase [Candidatus Hydrogenedentota bacterium]
MDGLMMDFPLTLDLVLRRAEQHFHHKEIVTRMPGKGWHRYTYGEMAVRAKRLALALQSAGIKEGDCVATLCWNHYRHLEAYIGVPVIGAVLHTLNLRLHPDDLAYIASDARDRMVIVDESLLPLLNQFKDAVGFEKIIVVTEQGVAPDGMEDYEAFIAPFEAADYVQIPLRENMAAGICYTSGTTGKPKGVVYSHRSNVLHSIGAGLESGIGLSERDTLLPVVPMFHANSWGLPYAALMLGPKLVFPGPYLDGETLLDGFASERVTVSAGVPTVWNALLATLAVKKDDYDLRCLRKLIVGGSAVPVSMIQAFDEKYGIGVVQAWGMTELSPVGTVSNLTSALLEAPKADQYLYRAMQGTPMPLVEIRARGDAGLAAWDGETMGELEVRGPWISSAYLNRPDAADRFTEDGWFKTGDIVTIDPVGYIKIQDRSKDLVKSGGEWISSVDLENTIMGHEDVAEAAVIAVPHPKWDERPLAVVVRRAGSSLDEATLRCYLAERVAKWWIPDAIVFVEEIPKTSVGKFKKTALREQFSEYQFQQSN